MITVAWFIIGLIAGMILIVMMQAYMSPDKFFEMEERLDRYKSLNEQIEKLKTEYQAKMQCDDCNAKQKLLQKTDDKMQT